jgi:hypothetical protein
MRGIHIPLFIFVQKKKPFKGLYIGRYGLVKKTAETKLTWWAYVNSICRLMKLSHGISKI